MAAEKEQKGKESKKEEKAERKEQHKEAARPEKRVLNVVRLGETNLDGNRNVFSALLGIKGISFAFSRAVSDISGMGERKVSELKENELQKLEDIINHPEKYNVPSWMYNRRKDHDRGETKHLTTSQLDLSHKMDIDREKKVRSYKGVRHMAGLPVRGQRTRSSFRSGGTVGVQRKAAKAAAAAARSAK
jgi:small subunit ribosomal protein S13